MLKALVVDDERIVRETLKEIVQWEDCGFVVETVGDGESAYSIISKEKIDVVITDVKMPRMDGVELCRLIHDNCKHTKIILLSAYKDFEIAHAALKSGAVEYILKPLTHQKVEELEKVLTDIYEQSRREKYRDYFLNDTSFEAEIDEYLEKKDLVYIDELFQRIAEVCGNDIVILKGICIKLNNHLFDYLVENGFDRNNITKKKNDCTQIINASEEIEQILICTQKRYESILQFDNGENDYYKAIVAKVEEYIRKNYKNSMLGVAEISDILHISNQHLSRIYKSQRGTTIREYITDVRMRQAKILLETTSHSINIIAEKCGYESGNYFGRMFKSLYNLTPTEYRKSI